MCPTQEICACPHFGDTYTSPELSNDDDGCHGRFEKPQSTAPNGEGHTKSDTNEAIATRRTLVSDIINSVFTVYNLSTKHSISIIADDNILFINLDQSSREIIDSDNISHGKRTRLES